MRRIVFAIFVLCLAAVVHAAEEQWFSVHLDGRKIGHMHTQRTIEADGGVRHEQWLALTLERNGEPLSISSRERSWETADGRPLAFESETDTAGSRILVSGKVREGRALELRIEPQLHRDTERLPWPPGALLSEGQRLAAERAGFTAGTEYQLRAFDPASLQALTIHTRVGRAETVMLHGRKETLIPLEQRFDIGGLRTETQSWVTPKRHELRRLRLPVLGLQLEMLACDCACALAPVQASDVLAATMIESPEPLHMRDLRQRMRYRLRLAQGGSTALESPPGQRVQTLERADEVLLSVDPRGDPRSPPQAQDLASNRWLQADDPALIAVAKDAARGARDEALMLEQLERFVRQYITTKSLRVGYASAGEILRNREGDCTEHAVLLAALARALGIPARVATGVAYAPAYAGQRNVFVPHAWVYAWVDGAWRGYDAALPRFDAGHIAFTVGDGDPFRFYAGIELLGGIEVLEAVPAEKEDTAQTLSEAVR